MSRKHKRIASTDPKGSTLEPFLVDETDETSNRQQQVHRSADDRSIDRTEKLSDEIDSRFATKPEIERKII